MDSIPELVDRPRAAKLLGGVSIKTVDRLRKRGAIASCSVGERSIRIEAASIDAYLERQLAQTRPKPAEAREQELFPIPALEAIKRQKGERRGEAQVAGGSVT
jgi:hypothetical protein